jgi:hypothetical protein
MLLIVCRLDASDESPQSFAGTEALQVFKASGVSGAGAGGAPPLADLPRRLAEEHADIT